MATVREAVKLLRKIKRIKSHIVFMGKKEAEALNFALNWFEEEADNHMCDKGCQICQEAEESFKG